MKVKDWIANLFKVHEDDILSKEEVRERKEELTKRIKALEEKYHY